jgi:Flp pilus assembly protein TadD
MPRLSPAAKAIRFAITGAVAAGLLAGCAGSSSRQLARAGDAVVREKARHGHAVDQAEQAVAKTPGDAAARSALGQAYLDAGRFESAAVTFGDAAQLGDASARVQLSLALARIGAGDTRGAVAVLDDAADSIPAADRGLALALAGETSRGVAILLDTLRNGENTTKLRQNLAFAYALDGRWREARIAMAQDVPADRIDDRISDWAMMSQPEDVQRRVATLLSVPIGVVDPGQPARLALGATTPGVQFAAAPAASAAPAADAELPALAPTQAPASVPGLAEAPAPAAAPVVAEPVSSRFAVAFAAPPHQGLITQPVADAVVPTVRAPAAYRIERPATAPRAAQLAPLRAPTLASDAGTHLVQLGSFSSEANARRAWGIYTARNTELRGYRLTITPVVVRGKNYWRVAAAGLDRGGASRLCSGLKSRGGACFAYAANHVPGVDRPAMALAVNPTWIGTGAGAGVKARHR